MASFWLPHGWGRKWVCQPVPRGFQVRAGASSSAVQAFGPQVCKRKFDSLLLVMIAIFRPRKEASIQQCSSSLLPFQPQLMPRMMEVGVCVNACASYLVARAVLLSMYHDIMVYPSSC
eukprot:1142377-Pelagomonas_calceolata.AAC.7